MSKDPVCCRDAGHPKKHLPTKPKLGLKKALVTCDKTNIASAKIIEKNGGVLENEIFVDEQAGWKKRYWINLPA